MLEKLYPFRWQILFLLLGSILVIFGLFIDQVDFFSQPTVEVLENEDIDKADNEEIVVEISGSVVNAGVYKLNKGDRVDDLLYAAGGLSDDANLSWLEKYVNRASPLVDGQKLYIASEDEQTDVLSANDNGGGNSSQTGSPTTQNSRVNVNTASQSELEALWGIGPVTAQNIIEQRMYTSVEELLEKGILKSNVYERNKDLLSVY